jgi:hypothetical protein
VQAVLGVTLVLLGIQVILVLPVIRALLVQEELGVMGGLGLLVTQVTPEAPGIKETPGLQVLAGLVVLAPIQAVGLPAIECLTAALLAGKLLILAA